MISDNQMAKQVFYDPLQARWRRIRRLFDAAAIVFTLLVIFFLYSALRSEPLPDLSLGAEKRPYHALKEAEKVKAREKRRLATIARPEPSTCEYACAIFNPPTSGLTTTKSGMRFFFKY